MSLKPFHLWGQMFGPNPVKVRILLQELNIPFTDDPLDHSGIKQPEFLAVNPNGRVPAIYDPNNDITLWESGAIVEYLVEKYDPERKISFEPGSKEAYHAKQWLHFQATGQGPYYGQLIWFKFFHSEKLPSAVQRYAAEAKRVTGVLEGHLEKQAALFPGSDGPWLVGGKYSYADLAWVPWQVEMMLVAAEANLAADGFDPEEFPIVKGWIGKMRERKAIGDTAQQFWNRLASRLPMKG
ncbi:glutathione S- transferase, nitrogen catabolite repression regulator [Kalmusia sp. IMI 367209]|nr:glutathione S- transferase, nitrogen catabolite repression regulator [Kalmusia sp. IMI 367209]